MSVGSTCTKLVSAMFEEFPQRLVENVAVILRQHGHPTPLEKIVLRTGHDAGRPTIPLRDRSRPLFGTHPNSGIADDDVIAGVIELGEQVPLHVGGVGPAAEKALELSRETRKYSAYR